MSTSKKQAAFGKAASVKGCRKPFKSAAAFIPKGKKYLERKLKQ
jgi:hypothetical protein